MKIVSRVLSLVLFAILFVHLGIAADISISWKDNSNNEQGFNVFRAESPAGPWLQITTTVDATWRDRDLPEGKIFYYRVTAFNTAGQSNPSNTASARTASSTPIPVKPLSPSETSAIALPLGTP